jgi:hypothetical protein
MRILWNFRFAFTSPAVIHPDNTHLLFQMLQSQVRPNVAQQFSTAAHNLPTHRACVDQFFGRLRCWFAREVAVRYRRRCGIRPLMMIVSDVIVVL